MTSREFRERVLARARRSNVAIKTEWIDRLERYFMLLSRWNSKINLTALPLEDPTDSTFDRLLIEPLAASRFLIDVPEPWWDLGSGGGSPAIPIKISKPALQLIMVEAKTRKAAFLRESIRQLNLDRSAVIDRRFDELTGVEPGYGSGRFVTVRAVRTDRQLLAIAAKLLGSDGRLLMFRPTDRPLSPPGFRYVESALLTDAPQTYLTILERVFHVEQKPLTPP